MLTHLCLRLVMTAANARDTATNNTSKADDKRHNAEGISKASARVPCPAIRNAGCHFESLPAYIIYSYSLLVIIHTGLHLHE